MEMQLICIYDENSKVEKRLLRECNKIQGGDEIPMGKRQIFNSVEYSEAIVESLVLGREKCKCQIIIYVGKGKIV